MKRKQYGVETNLRAKHYSSTKMNGQSLATTKSDGENEKWRSTKQEWCSKSPKRCSEQ